MNGASGQWRSHIALSGEHANRYKVDRTVTPLKLVSLSASRKSCAQKGSRYWKSSMVRAELIMRNFLSTAWMDIAMAQMPSYAYP